MSGLPQRYNPRFIQYFRENGGRPDLQTLGEYGITIFRHAEKSAYRVLGIHHLSGQENAGKHHIFFDVLDEDGQRIKDALIKIQVGNNPPTYIKLDKPPVEPGTNTPMWANTQYQVSVANHPSDSVIGLHTGHPDEPGGGNTWGHHSFYVVFGRVAAAVPEPLPPEPTPVPPVGNEPPEDYTEALRLTIQALIELRQKVEAVQADVTAIKTIVQLQEQRVKKTAAVWQG